MIRKGKFKLFSYIVEDFLIFYKSINRNKKIISFSILESEDFFPLITILNNFLKQRFLNYYSIQISTTKRNKKLFFLNNSS